jgi:hypothetical protein
MIRSLVLGTMPGGLTAFLWSGISWGLLSWHKTTLRTFQNEDDVSAVIASHITESGTHLLPGGPSQQGMTSEQKKAAQRVVTEKMQKGPVMFAAIRRGGFGSYSHTAVSIADYLLTWLIAGLVIAKVAKPRTT